MQGAQSLYQMSRLSTAADDVAASSKFSGEVRNLWARFLDTENALKQVTAFMDTASADEYRKDFDQKPAALRNQIGVLQSGASGDLKEGASAISGRSMPGWPLRPSTSELKA